MTITMFNQLDDTDDIWADDLQWEDDEDDEESSLNLEAWAPFGRRNVEPSKSNSKCTDSTGDASSSLSSYLSLSSSSAKTRSIHQNSSSIASLGKENRYLDDCSDNGNDLFSICFGRTLQHRQLRAQETSRKSRTTKQMVLTPARNQGKRDFWSSCPEFEFDNESFCKQNWWETDLSDSEIQKNMEFEEPGQKVVLPRYNDGSFELIPRLDESSTRRRNGAETVQTAASRRPKFPSQQLQPKQANSSSTESSKSARGTARKESLLTIEKDDPQQGSNTHAIKHFSSSSSVPERCQHTSLRLSNVKDDLQLPPAFAHLLARPGSNSSKNSKITSRIPLACPHASRDKRSCSCDEVRRGGKGEMISSQIPAVQSTEKAPTAPLGDVRRLCNEPAWLLRLRWKQRGASDPPFEPLHIGAVQGYSCRGVGRDGSMQKSPAITGCKGVANQQVLELKWTKEPVSNFSDWVFAVVTGWTENDTIETYYVHKSVVGIGPRSSSYFRELFESSQSSSENFSVIELDQGVAAAFPIMLDYMYSFSDQSLKIATENAVKLRVLGKRFGVPFMVDEADHFIRKSPSLSNTQIYLTDAARYDDKELIKLLSPMSNA